MFGPIRLLSQRITGSAPGRDAPHVFTRIIPKAELEQADPALAGKLSIPVAERLPPGVSVREHTTGEGRRAVTVNIHMGVPGDVSLGDLANESIEGLRAVAAHVNALNPDVVFVQEMRNRPAIGRPGISEAASVFAHLLGADSMAFTPAVQHDPAVQTHRNYGTAVYTRNGFKIVRAANVALPNGTPDIEARSAGVVKIQPPKRTLLDRLDPRRARAFTAIGSHTANEPVKDIALRAAQLDRVAEIVERLGKKRSFEYRDAIGLQPQKAKHFPPVEMVGGDFNQKQEPTDQALARAGLVHVNELWAATVPDADVASARRNTAFVEHGNMATLDENGHRIDMLYGPAPTSGRKGGIAVSDVNVSSVPQLENGVYPTDHRVISVDYQRAANSRFGGFKVLTDAIARAKARLTPPASSS